MMLSDAIQTIAELVEKSKSPVRLKDYPKRNRSAYAMPNGQIKEVEADPAPRNHNLTEIASLAVAVELFKFDDRAVAWVSFDGVVVVMDDENFGENRLTLKTVPSPLFESLSNKKDCDPKELVWFLRCDCATAELEPENLELLVANLRFRTEDEETREHDRQADGMGRRIRSEVTGSDQLPELVEISFMPFPAIADEVPKPVTVRCSLLADPTKRTVALKPLPGAIEAAKTAAVYELAIVIRGQLDEHAKVLCGRP